MDETLDRILPRESDLFYTMVGFFRIVATVRMHMEAAWPALTVFQYAPCGMHETLTRFRDICASNLKARAENAARALHHPGIVPSPWPHNLVESSASVPIPACRRSLEKKQQPS